MSSNPSINVFKTILFTGLALLAFAANSVLCRLALGEHTIDAAGFSLIRLLSGSVVLVFLLTLQHQFKKNSDQKITNQTTSILSKNNAKGSWFAALMLFVYAVCFSFAYLSLKTGTGALILFGAVQITMIVHSLFLGNKLVITEWLGVLLAFAGFIYLMLPGASVPPFYGMLLMTLSGIAWGFYTLKGRTSTAPLQDTAYNFLRTIPFVFVLLIIYAKNLTITPTGVVLALLSGGIASAIGYTLWYMALTGLSVTQAAVVQLLVPVIAALGGIIFVLEPITFRLVLSSLMILGGILLVVLGRYYVGQKQ